MMNATELNNVTEIGSAILLLPVITNSTKASDKGSMEGQELGMSNTATLWVQSDFFCATVLTIDITKPIMGFQKKKKILYILLHDKYICMRKMEKAVFYQVRVVGEQDTLLNNTGTHYFYQTFIQGSVDFICGQAKSLFHLRIGEQLQLIIEIQQKKIQDFHLLIAKSKEMVESCLEELGENIQQQLKTAVFGEYQCYGKGSNRTGRVEWSKNFNSEEAMPFLGRDYINGDQWLRLQ
ncbi:hypothetical protein Ahy_A07g031168 [Arachis hypogaea]|uniref:pectinesterase n=1 Tax=Arachis hypogaea TaxID=3818 RepID=A0A445C327_ARAHY|nr:hypothetical protein Ahy_A07g031168 [Arachis hypogaea]